MDPVDRSPGVKTFKLLQPCIKELEPFLKKSENKFVLLFVGFEDPGFLNFGPSSLFQPF